MNCFAKICFILKKFKIKKFKQIIAIVFNVLYVICFHTLLILITYIKTFQDCLSNVLRDLVLKRIHARLFMVFLNLNLLRYIPFDLYTFFNR